LIYLKDQNTTGFADYALNYGLPGDKPVIGDWNNNGIDTIGIYRNGSSICATATRSVLQRSFSVWASRATCPSLVTGTVFPKVTL
jgi:hypothetical protein